MDRLLSMRVFQKVIDEGGFAAAARALDMSPAVVTRLVADLENHIGTRLLHRTTRRVSLTPIGENYLNRVRAILQDIDEAHSAASAQTHEPAGELRVLMPPALATFLLAPMVAQFRQRHPRIRLHIEVDSHNILAVEDYDLALMPVTDRFDGNIIARKILASEAILVCSPDYIKRRGTPLIPEDLAGHEMLHLRSPEDSLRVLRLYDPEHQDAIRDVAIEPGLWINHIETLLRTAVDGAGVASVVASLAAPYLANGQLVRVLRPWITGRWNLYAALPSRRHIPERTRLFLDFLAEAVRSHQEALSQAQAKITSVI